MTGDAARRGVYPGSFNPPTVAHLAIAEAARAQRRLDVVDFVVSRVALAKEQVERPRLEDRVDVLRRSLAHLPWADVVVTDRQLLADIAAGYDVVIMGADKWEQVNDPAFYGGSHYERDGALARLPELAIAGRPPLRPPDAHRLDVGTGVDGVSSTAARRGSAHHMTPVAAEFDRRTGAWSDPARYGRWLAGG